MVCAIESGGKKIKKPNHTLATNGCLTSNIHHCDCVDKCLHVPGYTEKIGIFCVFYSSQPWGTSGIFSITDLLCLHGFSAASGCSGGAGEVQEGCRDGRSNFLSLPRFRSAGETKCPCAGRWELPWDWGEAEQGENPNPRAWGEKQTSTISCHSLVACRGLWRYLKVRSEPRNQKNMTYKRSERFENLHTSRGEL